MHTGECHVELKVEIKVTFVPAKEHPKWQANHQKLEEKHERDPSAQPQKNPTLPTTWSWTSGLQTVRQAITMFKPLSRWYFVSAILGNEYRHCLYSRASNEGIFFLYLTFDWFIHRSNIYWIQLCEVLWPQWCARYPAFVGLSVQRGDRHSTKQWIHRERKERWGQAWGRKVERVTEYNEVLFWMGDEGRPIWRGGI